MAEYFRRGVSAVHFTTVLSSLTSPSIAEIDANGEDLTARLGEMTGWEFANSPIPTPKLSTTFTTTIPGEDTTPNPEMVFYDSDETDDVRTILAKGATGWVVLCPYGYTATKASRVFPVTVTGANDDWTLGNEAAKFTVGFAVSAAPTLTGSALVA
jgi:hypothetical protein